MTAPNAHASMIARNARFVHTFSRVKPLPPGGPSAEPTTLLGRLGRVFRDWRQEAQ